MKIVTIVGARPQFIKASPVSRLLRIQHHEVLVHTGQHYDENMSAIFFEELDIPAPDYHLGVGSGSHGKQTGAMLVGIEEILQIEQPDWVLIYGDTNSTLAGALAAAKLHIKIAHVEAGLRSYNRRMPEEINRILSDHISHLLLCPSQVAVDNLSVEGIKKGVALVGDVMADALAYAVEHAGDRSRILERLDLTDKQFLLATVHRAENTENLSNLQAIWDAFTAIDEPIVFVVHPRTRKCIEKLGLTGASKTQNNRIFQNPILIEPLGYLDTVQLMKSARLVLTDSGGMQKEAYWLGIPCLTMRDETEWIETVQSGWNTLVGADKNRIMSGVRRVTLPATRSPLYGDGNAASCVIRLLESYA